MRKLTKKAVNAEKTVQLYYNEIPHNWICIFTPDRICNNIYCYEQ